MVVALIWWLMIAWLSSTSLFFLWCLMFVITPSLSQSSLRLWTVLIPPPPKYDVPNLLGLSLWTGCMENWKNEMLNAFQWSMFEVVNPCFSWFNFFPLLQCVYVCVCDCGKTTYAHTDLILNSTWKIECKCVMNNGVLSGKMKCYCVHQIIWLYYLNYICWDYESN